MCTSNMDQLPNEVLLKILSYLTTYDVMNFCTALGSDWFLKDSVLNRSVDFSRRFELQDLNLCTYIIRNLNFSSIKSLNVSYLYWISADQLRTLIKQLENLEVLRAIDTELGLGSKDIDEYVKLKKLAVSINVLDHHSIEASKKLKTLNSLCLKILHKRVVHHLYAIFKELHHLEELWISDEDKTFQGIDYHFIVNILTKLKKLFIKSKIPLPYESFDEKNFFRTFECRKNGPAAELILEKFSSRPEDIELVSKSEGNGVEESLELLQTSLHDLPCGPVESKQLYFKKCMESIYFDELNFCYPVILCNSKYNDAAVQILSSKNSVKLRKLRFRSCLFQTSQIEEGGESTSETKRLRKETAKEPPTHPFSVTAENLKNLQDLEIETCPVCNKGVVLSAYLSIQTFENIRKLTLEVPHLLNGSFLTEVFKKCQDLESLNLTCVVQNQHFITDLCLNLKYATNLRDFRLENKEIKIDTLLESFNENKKLQRIVIKCSNLQYARGTSQTKPFHVFVKNSPHLILFVVMTNKVNNNIQETLDKFGSIPAKVFFVTSTGNYPFGHGVPDITHRDILFNYTNIGAINIDQF